MGSPTRNLIVMEKGHRAWQQPPPGTWQTKFLPAVQGAVPVSCFPHCKARMVAQCEQEPGLQACSCECGLRHSGSAAIA